MTNVVNLRYKPLYGFEIDKLTLLQKDGKYYYQYKTLNETFEETINKSIYEELIEEKELFLSLLDCELKNLWWLDTIRGGLLGYNALCIITIVILLFLQIINIVCIIFGLKIGNAFPLPIVFLFIEIFILLQMFLSAKSYSTYLIQMEQAVENYKYFKQNIQKIRFFDTRKIHEKFDNELDSFSRYQEEYPERVILKGAK